MGAPGRAANEATRVLCNVLSLGVKHAGCWSLTSWGPAQSAWSVPELTGGPSIPAGPGACLDPPH